MRSPLISRNPCGVFRERKENRLWRPPAPGRPRSRVAAHRRRSRSIWRRSRLDGRPWRESSIRGVFLRCSAIFWRCSRLCSVSRYRVWATGAGPRISLRPSTSTSKTPAGFLMRSSSPIRISRAGLQDWPLASTRPSSQARAATAGQILLLGVIMMRTGSALFTFASILAGAIPASAQSVVSTHSGVVYYFDGAVFLGDQPLQARLGTFPSVPVGWELRTEKGKAEVLLTPGVFLRMGENSSIRMVANDLANTRVELLEGSAIIDAPQQASGTSVTLLFRNWEIRPGRSGSCRLDSNPPRLWVSRGEAEVSGADGQPVKVEQGMDLPLAKVLVPDQAAPQPLDDLSVWDQGRSDSIAADNAITQQIDQDPASHPADVDAFTYFPMLGVPAPGLYSSPYPSVMDRK